MTSAVRTIAFLFDALRWYWGELGVWFADLSCQPVPILEFGFGRRTIFVVAARDAAVIRHHPCFIKLLMDGLILWRVAMVLLFGADITYEERGENAEGGPGQYDLHRGHRFARAMVASEVPCARAMSSAAFSLPAAARAALAHQQNVGEG